MGADRGLHNSGVREPCCEDVIAGHKGLSALLGGNTKVGRLGIDSGACAHFAKSGEKEKRRLDPLCRS